MSFMSTFPEGLYDAHEDEPMPPTKSTEQRIAELEKQRLAKHAELDKLAEEIGRINELLRRLRGTRRPKS